ncbi:MAG: hypothetical protein WAN36_08695 [Calditrichia bacterium]
MKALLILFFLLCLTVPVFSQQAQQQPDTTVQSAEIPAERTIIDLTQMGKTYSISARMEMPQVKIFDRRKKPDFQDVTAEKSFLNELTGGADQIRYEPVTSGQVPAIDDVETLLNKKRF